MCTCKYSNFYNTKTCYYFSYPNYQKHYSKAQCGGCSVNCFAMTRATSEQPISISVSLPKPSISMNPAGEVTLGQDVGITCSIATQQSGGTFILQKTSGSFKKTQISSTNSATFSIIKVNLDNKGAYRCQYQIQVSSQVFSSPLSDSLRLSVSGKEK
uniref:Ig-like domain-containing protein n=1 Tax=Dicentrarchus labrax TaxID=13489 RepID=A0A8P4GGC2_DICLA